MNKTNLISLFSALTFSSMAFAGGMGDSNTCCAAFISLEGGYSWSSINNYNFTLIGANTALISNQDKQPYGARLAAGMISMVDDEVGFTGELAWGYYGKKTLNPAISGLASPFPGALSISNTLYGFDALLGVAYVQPYFSLSFKAGAMVQNMLNNTTAALAPLGFPIIDTLNVKTNHTQVLPEIKVGAAYNFNQNWAITASYLLAVGTTADTGGSLDVNTGRVSLNINHQNPTINTALLGIQFTV